jgi:hypothetical protein
LKQLIMPTIGPYATSRVATVIPTRIAPMTVTTNAFHASCRARPLVTDKLAVVRDMDVTLAPWLHVIAD